MLTPLIIAAELILLQGTTSEPTLTTQRQDAVVATQRQDAVVATQRQDAVVVVRDGVRKDGAELVTVTHPISQTDFPFASLKELQEMNRLSDRTAAKPAMEFIVDRTIGGHPKGKVPQNDEGGIAGDPPALDFDLVFHIATSSVIPANQLAQFEEAIAQVEFFFESQINTEATVDIQLIYVQLAPGRLGTTACRYATLGMQSVCTVLNTPSVNDGDDVQSTPVSTTLPIRYSGVNIAVTPENRVYVTQALQKALGLYVPGGIGALQYDGRISLNNSIQWDFLPADGVSQGTIPLYSFQDALIREVLQLMGYVAGSDFLIRDCTVMDCFRFQRDVLESTWYVNSNTDYFGPPHPPAAVNCAGAATLIEDFIAGGGMPPGWGLDYNPGLDKGTLAAALAQNPAFTANAIMTAAGGPNPTVYLTNQMRGRLNADGTAMLESEGNAFDDARIPDAPAPGDPSEVTAYPDGAMQSLTTVGAGAAARCIAVDFREQSYTVGGAPLTVEFRGAMPRLVSRNSPADGSIMNFLMDTTAVPSDFEIAMYDGSPVRACFVKQDELSELGSRCLMGKSIGRGTTWWSRDNAALPIYSVPLGELPDFLTRREWLMLDMMGWNINLNAGAHQVDITRE